MSRLTHPHFIPSDAAGDRRSTAILLVGTAQEKDIDQRDIATTHTGFFVTDAIADALDGTKYEVKRDTNPYATVEGPLADRRLNINSDLVGEQGEARTTTTTIRTVDGPLADKRLNPLNPVTGNAPRDLSEVEVARTAEQDAGLGLDDEDDDLSDGDDLLDDGEEPEVEDEDDEEDDEDGEGVETEEDGTYDPAEMVDQGMKPIQAFVTENPEQAETIRAAEVEGKNRPKMLTWLDEFIAERGPATNADL